MPPIDKAQQSRISLLVDIDRQSQRRVRQQLHSLSERSVDLQIDPGKVKELVQTVREAAANGGKVLNSAVTDAFDKQISRSIYEFGVVQDKILKAVASGDEVGVERFIKEQALLEERIKAEGQAHKARIKAAEDLKEAFAVNPKNISEVSDAFGTGFTSALNKTKSGDLSGIAESFATALKGGLEKGGKFLGDIGKSQGDKGTKLAILGEAMTKASVAVVGVSAAVVALVGALIMADEQAKNLNKTLMEGAGLSDFSDRAKGVAQVERTLDAAREAAFNLASEFRGTGEEFIGIMSELNQAGLSYEEMARSVGGVRSETEALEKVTRSTFQWSKALGISTSEVADTMATWSSQFGADLEMMNESFASIAGYALEGGFNVKRFFTSVSQATAGMAIYNVRMEEAGFLLSKTQKILGDTDASDFIKSLTQGFSDESMVDRMKRIMIAGGKDTQAIFEGTATRTARSFADAFSSSAVKDPLEKAFKTVNASITAKDLTDPRALRETWGKMDAKSRRLVVAQLRQNGDEQSNAASRQLETLSDVLDAQKGGLSEQARGLGALDMQGKLAFKLQTLGDKRLNEMGAVELAAFESYAGISGSQLEQLMRVESQLMADYELAKEQGKADGQSFNQWIASNDEATAKLSEVEDIQDRSTYFAEMTVKNTRSMSAILQNTVASILNDIYGLMTTWFGSSKELSAEAQDTQARALEEIRAQREASYKGLEDLDARLADLDATMSTSGKDSEAYQKAALEKKALEGERTQHLMAKEFLRAQERQVLQLSGDQVEGAKSPEDLAKLATKALVDSGEGLDIASRFASPEALAALRASQESSTAGQFTSRGVGLGAGRSDVAMGFGASSSMSSSANKGKDAKAAALEEFMLGGNKLAEDQLATLTRQEATLLEEQRLAEKQAGEEKKWRDSEYAAETTDAQFEAMKKMEGWALAQKVGLTGDRANQAADEWASGDTALGRGLLAERLRLKGMDPFALATEGGPVAQDFIYRPGQPLQHVSSADTIVGAKPGGAIDQASRAAPGSVVINNHINGGDLTQVYKMVQNAIKAAGVR